MSQSKELQELFARKREQYQRNLDTPLPADVIEALRRAPGIKIEWLKDTGGPIVPPPGCSREDWFAHHGLKLLEKDVGLRVARIMYTISILEPRGEDQ